MEEDEAPDPVRVSLLGAQAQVAEAGDAADAVEESGLLHGDKRTRVRKVLSRAGGRGHHARGAGAAGVKRFGLSLAITELCRTIRLFTPY